RASTQITLDPQLRTRSRSTISEAGIRDRHETFWRKTIPSPMAGTTARTMSRSACAIAPGFTPVLCNRYDLPMVEFKMARCQGATREHVVWSEPDWHYL